MINRVSILLLVLFVGFSTLFGQKISKIDSLKVALDIAKDEKNICRIYMAISDEYIKELYDSALIYADKALELAENIKDEQLIADAYMQLGACFFWQENYSRVITIYFKALRYYELLAEEHYLITIYFNIGLVYDNLGEEEKGREYYLKSLEMSKSLAERDTTAMKAMHFGRIYNNIGVTYSDMKEYDQALEYYDKAIKFSQVSGNKDAMQFVYTNIGNVYKEKGQYEAALSNYRKSLILKEESDNQKGIGLTYFYMGDCYILMGKEQEGIQYLMKAKAIADSTDYLTLQKDVAEKLSLEYAKTGDYKNSYFMHLVFKELSDSLNYIESSRTATRLEMEYEFDKHKAKQQENRRRRDMVFTVTAIVLFLVLCIVSLLYVLARNKYRQHKLKQDNLKLERKQLKQDLEFKNKELATNVMYLFRKNELNNQIVEKLLRLKYELRKSNQKPLNDIILELQSNIDSDVWKEFEVRFQQVHESFYKNLQERFPDLTANEKRLCAFLKLNMTTKEIAAITQKSLHSIDVARTRLRKKLNITNTEIEISSFLAKL